MKREIAATNDAELITEPGQTGLIPADDANETSTAITQMISQPDDDEQDDDDLYYGPGN